PHVTLSHLYRHSFPTRRSSDLVKDEGDRSHRPVGAATAETNNAPPDRLRSGTPLAPATPPPLTSFRNCFVPSLRRFLGSIRLSRSEEHTSELQSPDHLVCRLLL